LTGNKGFIYKRETKKRINKFTNLIEEGKLKSARKHYGSQFGITSVMRKERQTNGSLFEKLVKVRNIEVQKEGI